ncbi:MAG: rhodanese-like domain-containing protein [Flavobacteriaceae bacterium]|nr:rhodanese-like domain-containing protein [Flavobacteriaceae bacterium]
MSSILSFFRPKKHSHGFVSLDAFEFSENIKRKNGQLIDVRTPNEFLQGHISKAKNINFFDANFAEQLAKFSKDQTVFVYCQSGMRSKKAARLMADLGFKEIFELSGGYLAWKRNF